MPSCVKETSVSDSGPTGAQQKDTCTSLSLLLLHRFRITEKKEVFSMWELTQSILNRQVMSDRNPAALKPHKDPPPPPSPRTQTTAPAFFAADLMRAGGTSPSPSRIRSLQARRHCLLPSLCIPQAL
jgi:hypothetical protein